MLLVLGIVNLINEKAHSFFDKFYERLREHVLEGFIQNKVAADKLPCRKMTCARLYYGTTLR